MRRWKLLCTALLGSLTFHALGAPARIDAAYAQPTDRQEILRAGAAMLHVTVRGQGEPIVFIPGLIGRGAEDYDYLSRRLVQEGYRTILPQPRGIGGSTGTLENITLHDFANDVATVIEAEGGGPAVLIGHALGNRIARVIAVDHPILVKKIVLLAAGGSVPPAPDMDQAYRRIFNPALPEADRFAAIQLTLFAPGHDAKPFASGWDLKVAAAQAVAAFKTPLIDWWSGGSAPMLVLQATHDAIAVPENSRRLLAEFPNRVTLVEIPDSGHAMLPEQPEAIASAIIAYLKR